MKIVQRTAFALVILMLLAAAYGGYWWNSSDRDQLRHIVTGQCVPHQ